MIVPDWAELVWGLSTFLLFIFLIVVAARALRRPSSQRPHALSILEERYARGEIDRDEFLERRRMLLDTDRS